MRRILFGGIVILASAAFLLFTLGNSNGPSGRVFHIELDNAYDLTAGGEFKVAGVNAGTIQSIGLDQKTLHAVVTVQVTQSGFGQFHRDAFCQSRPQSLIGEYFIDCQPGTSGPALKSGATIPASHTQSTIPADLVQNIMRMPYRERFSLIINELGAAVAARSEDLQTALRRADPALAQTDNLLALLANDAQTIKNLNVNANTVITALAKNNNQVKRFIQYAGRASTDSATQANNITLTWQRLPAFLQQLRPTLAKLGAAADAQDPVLTNLHAAAGNLNQFFHLLVPFAHESVPSLRSLGQASVTGRSAVKVATPTIKDLNQFARKTPELAKNLSIVLGDLNNRNKAAEPDPRSPDGGRGYTGLEALLQYAYNITEAVDYFGPFGHLLGVDAFANPTCSPYATPQTIANNFANYHGNPNTYSSSNPRSCYAFLGPHQPGVTVPDPTFSKANATPANPSQCVPDPGGFPVEPPQYHVHYSGAQTSACKLQASTPGLSSNNARTASANGVGASGGGTGSGQPSTGPPGSQSNSASSSPVSPVQRVVQGLFGGAQSTANQTTNTAKKTIKKAAGGAVNTVQNAGSGIGGAAANTASGATSGTSSSGSGSTGQTQQLLNYLLAP